MIARQNSWWAIASVAAIAVALRGFHLQTIPLWTDELFTRFYPQAGLGYLWGDGFRAEPTSPLYYSVVWAVEHVVGSQAWAIRAPSVAGSLASVAVAWLLGRELFEQPGAALIGALLLSLAPINLFYAQEARAYALQGAALGLALLGFARVLRGGSGLVVYAIGAVLAVWLHPTSVVPVAAMNAVALGSAVGLRALLDRRAIGRWIGANAAVVVACLPIVPALVAPPGGGAATSWIPALSRWSLESVVGETLGGPALLPWAQRIAEVGVIAIAGLVLVPPWRPNSPPWQPSWRVALVLGMMPGLSLLMMIGISAVKPILLSRTLAWLVLPLAVRLGGALSRRPVVVGVAVAVVVAAGSALQIGQAMRLKEDWPALFAQMPDLAAPTLVVLAPHSPPGAVAVYAPAAADPLRMDDGLPPVPETTIMPRLFGTKTIGQDEMVAAIDAGRPVWLIYRRPEFGWAQRLLAALPPPRRAIQSEPGRNPALRALEWAR